MKKTIVIVAIVLVAAVFLISFSVFDKHTVAVVHEEYLAEPLERFYRAGETVTVKVDNSDPGSTFHILVNGQRHTPADSNDQYLTFTFTMPYKDVILYIERIPVPTGIAP